MVCRGEVGVNARTSRGCRGTPGDTRGEAGPYRARGETRTLQLEENPLPPQKPLLLTEIPGPKSSALVAAGRRCFERQTASPLPSVGSAPLAYCAMRPFRCTVTRLSVHSVQSGPKK